MARRSWIGALHHQSNAMQTIVRKYSAGILTAIVYSFIVVFALCCSLGIL
jgi:hypothetical protein